RRRLRRLTNAAGLGPSQHGRPPGRARRPLRDPFVARPRDDGDGRASLGFAAGRRFSVASSRPRPKGGQQMSSLLNPYLRFDGNAREALDFYRDALGGNLTISTYGEFGDKDAPNGNNVMHGLLETPGGFTLMCADNPPGAEYQPGNTVALSLSGTDADELKGYWDKLTAGGMVTVPLEKQMWGDEFGMLV